MITDTPSIQHGETGETYTLADAVEQSELQQWIPHETHQISAGRYHSTCDVLTMGDMRIVRECQDQTVHKTGATPTDICTVSMAFHKDSATRFSNLYDPASSVLFFLPGDTEFDLLLSPNAETVYVCLPQEQLLALGQMTDERFWSRPPRDLLGVQTPYRVALAADLYALIDHHLAGEGDSPKTNQRAQLAVLDGILRAFSNATDVVAGDIPGFRTQCRTHQLVICAREIIEAGFTAGCVPSVIELCTQTGVSERTLEYAFRRELQITPCAYMRTLRLNRVHAALLVADRTETTVTRVATEWSFYHMGKFSQDYYRLFSERPSETLKKSCLAR